MVRKKGVRRVGCWRAFTSYLDMIFFFSTAAPSTFSLGGQPTGTTTTAAAAAPATEKKDGAAAPCEYVRSVGLVTIRLTCCKALFSGLGGATSGIAKPATSLGGSSLGGSSISTRSMILTTLQQAPLLEHSLYLQPPLRPFQSLHHPCLRGKASRRS